MRGDHAQPLRPVQEGGVLQRGLPEGPLEAAQEDLQGGEEVNGTCK